MYLKGNLSRVVYTEFNNRLTNVIRRSKRLCFVKLFYKAGTSSERIWSIFNDIIGKTHASLDSLVVGGSTLSGIPLANYINNFFASAAPAVTGGLTLPVTYDFITPYAELVFFLSYYVQGDKKCDLEAK